MSKKILLVDDSPLIHNLLRKTLVKHGHEVIGDAMNGKEGVELYRKLSPDLVFMDITMPVMDGIEAARAIKAESPEARIIMLSAMGDEEIISQAKELGVDIFLQKPFDDYKIISAIAKVV
ncbi:response regulator [Heliobacterium undosum]|uniref:Stage 0 sporulation protein A homolog n=1 Tax=Heliomicrobium undosum TaxID=121734 RepID=A0A845L165_9FIRM|nr:response regulator [Heliomicrobium undosum]MZP29953.1 response regulator [Heliomicrobium undosum]